jgi:rubrerythrin
MVNKLKCVKCGHSWNQRGSDKPKKCPCCTNPNWNKRNAKELIGLMLVK